MTRSCRYLGGRRTSESCAKRFDFAPIPDSTPLPRFNGWSVTLADSLDTMWLMGLKDEFYKALSLIRRQKFLKSVRTRFIQINDGG
jgi:hypothetical protein